MGSEDLTPVDGLIGAALFLLLTHFGISSTGLRDRLVARLGENPYRGVYSLIALGAFVWLSIEYRAAPFVYLWWAEWVTWVPMLVMPIALFFVVAAANPTNASMIGKVDTTDPARGILRVTRHPMMWGFALFAIAHIIANGDLASLILFGAITVLALLGTVFQDRKLAARGGDWPTFFAATSNIPFTAIAAGRQRLQLGEIGWRPVIIALALWMVIMGAHGWVFNVPAHPVM